MHCGYVCTYNVSGGGLVTKLCPTLVILWTIAHHVPLSMGFSRQEYWSGLPRPLPGDLPNPETEPTSLMSPPLAGGHYLEIPHNHSTFVKSKKLNVMQYSGRQNSKIAPKITIPCCTHFV